MSSIKTAVAALQNKGAVKSVQRGSYHNTNNSKDGSEFGASYKDIAISPINIDKSFIIVYSSYQPSSTGSQPANGRILSSTKIRIYGNLMSSHDEDRFYNVQWQVIEFY